MSLTLRRFLTQAAGGYYEHVPSMQGKKDSRTHSICLYSTQVTLPITRSPTDFRVPPRLQLDACRHGFSSQDMELWGSNSRIVLVGRQNVAIYDSKL